MTSYTRAILLGLLLSILGALGLVRLYASYQHGFLGAYFHTEPEAILFTGDMMLARAVEDRVRDVGQDRFFDRVRTLHERARYVVTNFEATVPLSHTRSPDFTFRFSVDSRIVPMLARAGVTHASLANNHANDFGSEARKNTEEVLRTSGVAPFGAPRTMASSSVAYIELEGSKVAIIGLEAVFGLLDTEELTALFAEAENNSDLQVVYVHFGDEYQPLHTKTQETLARTFVSLGADAVVGHHPHVVQDVELISGVPVFYSLGNYVFDQYWDDSVTTGLTVLMRIKDKRPVFELIPVATERGVPYVPNEAVSRELLESVARRSQEMLRSDIVRGVVSGELR